MEKRRVRVLSWWLKSKRGDAVTAVSHISKLPERSPAFIISPPTSTCDRITSCFLWRCVTFFGSKNDIPMVPPKYSFPSVSLKETPSENSLPCRPSDSK